MVGMRRWLLVLFSLSLLFAFCLDSFMDAVERGQVIITKTVAFVQLEASSIVGKFVSGIVFKK